MCRIDISQELTELLMIRDAAQRIVDEVDTLKDGIALSRGDSSNEIDGAPIISQGEYYFNKK